MMSYVTQQVVSYFTQSTIVTENSSGLPITPHTCSYKLVILSVHASQRNRLSIILSVQLGSLVPSQLSENIPSVYLT